MNLDVLKENKKTIVGMGIGILVGIIGLLLFRNILIFTVFLVVTMVFNFFQSRMQLPFDLSPSMALLILFSIKLGFMEGMVFLILGSIVPSIIGGGANHMTLFFFLLAMGVSYLGSLSLIINLRIYGIILIVVQSIFGYIIIKFFSDDPTDFLSIFLGLFVNIGYFLILTELIAGILT
ncbi:MAG: hypothetical protein GF368_04960 [Candidatus Aenigmarchaeota archaeon]|nr:hypothetical protein [Candidatus Aenigmarchaeota archaeon]